MSDPLDVEAAVTAATDELATLADPEQAPQMQAYMKTEMPFWGVKSPERRGVLRMLKADFRPATPGEYRELVSALWAEPHRETKYLAIDVATSYDEFIELDAMDLYERLIREGQWWDFVDGIAAQLVGRVFQKHRAEIEPMLREWIDDDDMWIRRTAILAQLKHKGETDADLLFEFCQRRMHETEFFIRKAIGWALRQFSYQNPDRVKTFLLAHRDELSGLSFREGAKALRRKNLMD